MSLWDTVVSDASDVILSTDDLAETITWDGSSVTALVRREMAAQHRDVEGSKLVTHARVVVAQADATPSRGLTVSLPEKRGGSAVDWKVDDWDVMGAFWVASVVRVERDEMSAEDYRAAGY